jgi:hypothetical protein
MYKFHLLKAGDFAVNSLLNCSFWYFDLHLELLSVAYLGIYFIK